MTREALYLHSPSFFVTNPPHLVRLVQINLKVTVLLNRVCTFVSRKLPPALGERRMQSLVNPAFRLSRNDRSGQCDARALCSPAVRIPQDPFLVRHGTIQPVTFDSDADRSLRPSVQSGFYQARGGARELWPQGARSARRTARTRGVPVSFARRDERHHSARALLHERTQRPEHDQVPRGCEQHLAEHAGSQQCVFPLEPIEAA